MTHFTRIAAAAAYFFCAMLAAQDYDLPSIGQPADNVLSPAEEERIGQQVVTELYRRGLVLGDPELSAYINQIGLRLASRTERAPSDFHFYVIDDRQINAFALPGGYIGINAGLIMESGTESELAGVVAHEIAHVTQRHIARQIEATQNMTWATAAAMLLAVIAGGGNPAVVQAAVTLGLSTLGQTQINYTRAHELEADRLGIRTLARANFDTSGMAGFFKRLERRSRLYGNQLPEILRTHPISTTRISEAQSRARDYAVKDIEESDVYPLMRARTRVVSSTQISDTVRYFEQKREADKDDTAADYGYALALNRIGRSQASVDILRKLNEREVGHAHYALALADAYKASGDLETALATLETVKNRFPSYRPLNLAYAETLIASGRAGEAREYLMSKSQLLGNDPMTHKLLAEAADKLGRKAEAYYRQAEFHHMRGQYAAAIHELRTALNLPDLSKHDESRIRAILNQYQRECARQLSEKECREKVEGDRRRRPAG